MFPNEILGLFGDVAHIAQQNFVIGHIAITEFFIGQDVQGDILINFDSHQMKLQPHTLHDTHSYQVSQISI